MESYNLDWINQFKKILVIRKREKTNLRDWTNKELVLQELSSGRFKVVRDKWDKGFINKNISLTDEAFAKAILMSWT